MWLVQSTKQKCLNNVFRQIQGLQLKEVALFFQQCLSKLNFSIERRKKLEGIHSKADTFRVLYAEALNSFCHWFDINLIDG